MSKTILLSRNKVAIIDDEDYDQVTAYNWTAVERPHTWYAQRSIKNGGRGTTQMLHVFIMGRPYIDHIDGDGLNNQKFNLRVASPTENRRNNRRRKGGYTSRYKGVYFNKRENKYRASIYINYKSIHLGYFANEFEAAIAYDRAALEYFGEFAMTNKMLGLL